MSILMISYSNNTRTELYTLLVCELQGKIFSKIKVTPTYSVLRVAAPNDFYKISLS